VTGAATTRRAACYLSIPIGGEAERAAQRDAVLGSAAAQASRVVGTFEDVVASEGGLAARTGLLELIASIGRGEVDVVIVERAERIATDTLLRCLVLHELHAAGIAVFTAAGDDIAPPPAEGEARTMRAMLTAANTFAQLPAVDALRRFRPPTGLARAHAEIQRLRAAGTSLTMLARKLNAMGLVDADGAPWTRLSVLAAARALPPVPGGD